MKRITKIAPYILIVFFVLGVHGLLLLNDGIYWDDWLWINLPGYSLNLDKITAAYGQMGFLPTNNVHLWLFSILGFRWVEFASLALVGVLVYAISQETQLFTRLEGVFIALIVIAYPAFQTWIVFSTANYVFYYALFFLAVFLSLKAEKSVGGHRYGWWIVSLFLFVLSYNLNSLLVFYFGFLALLVFYQHRVLSISWKQVLRRFLLRRWIYVLLPFLFWVVKQTFFPRYGYYANYNQFTFEPLSLVLNAGRFIAYGVYTPFSRALTLAVRQPALALLIGLVVYGCYRLFKLSSANFFKPGVRAYPILGFGVLLLGLAILPYIVVGLAPGKSGWDTRHTLLLGLPVALLILAGARLLFSRTEGAISVLGLMWLVVLVLMFGGSTISDYISWQTRWVKDRSIQVNLTRLNGAQDFSVYWVDDQFPAGGELDYRFHEWSAMFKNIWGDERRIGLDHAPSPDYLTTLNRYFTAAYDLSQFDPLGCQATLTIWRDRETLDDWTLSLQYFYYRFFQPDKMFGFLSGVTDLHIEPIAAPEATHCRN
jgi:hypothetical protein